MGPIPEVGSVWEALDQRSTNARGEIGRVVVVDTSTATRGDFLVPEARVTVQRLWSNGRLGSRWTTPLPMTSNYRRTNERYALGVANLTLSKASEKVLRSVARGDVSRNSEDNHSCWDASQGRKVTASVDALWKAELVDGGFEYATVARVKLTAKGQTWLDTHPAKEG